MANTMVNVMMPGAVDPMAETKAVYWRPVTATTVIKVGQPVCYNSDLAADYKERATTPNSGGAAYAEGAQNYNARLFVVEEPLTANLHSFAGIVAELGPKAGADGDLIKIYVPNGAVLPCSSNKSATLDSSVLGISHGEADLPDGGVPIGIAKETINRSGTDGLCWVKIDPNMFLYAIANGAALDIGAGYTFTNVHVTSAITTQFLPFQVRSTLTGTGAGGLIGAKFTTENAGTAGVGSVYGLWSQAACLTGGAISAAGKLVGMWAKTHTATDAGVQAGDIYGIQISIYNGIACSGRTAFMYFDEGTPVGETVDYLFEAYDSGPSGSCAYTADTSGTNQSGAMKIRIKGGDHYIHTFSTTVGAT